MLVRPPINDPSAKDNATMVMLRGIEYDRYAYVPKGSWNVRGKRSDYGAGMYWHISPALPDSMLQKMHAYVGERCNWDCGEVFVFVSGVPRIALGVATTCVLALAFISAFVPMLQ